jgi:phospholipase C
MTTLPTILGLALLTLLATSAAGDNPFAKVDRIVVIYQENWSFDSLLGLFPGANGISKASTQSKVQRMKNGTAYGSLPQALSGGVADNRFPTSMPNTGPWNVATYLNSTSKTGDLIHKFWHHKNQINGGINDRFVAWTDAGG